MFGMLWIGIYSSVFPGPANIQQLCTAIEEECAIIMLSNQHLDMPHL